MRWFAALLALLTGCGEEPESLRVATYNVHLARGEAGALIAELEAGSPQIDAVARVIGHADPDILLVNELDYDSDGRALALFRQRLSDAGIDYAYAYSAPVNTGLPTGLDLTGDGTDYGPEDAQGWGVFPGQFGMAILSRVPILANEARTYRRVLWADMPGNLYPAGYYPEAARGLLRLSSKSHWDIPVRIGDKTVHLLASHPTPPVFDGPEDRNGRRNADEILFWRDYIDGKSWMVSDQGTPGGLKDAPFVILGDLNNDPERGDGRHTAIRALLDHPEVSRTGETGPTATWKETGPLRVDYALPSRGLKPKDPGVLSPEAHPELREAILAASDHWLVYIDVTF